MTKLRLKVTPKQRQFIENVQAAWEEFEDSIWEMCEVVGVDEGAAGDMLSDMRVHIESIWSAYDVAGGGAS